MAKTVSDQSNGDTTGKYTDMYIGVVGRDKVTNKQITKLDEEYAKLSNKQKQSFWRTNSISSS
tara:strand:- start:1852 stop:2040 length:189 start_codon:yes stop_codon:yes gene_type:complete